MSIPHCSAFAHAVQLLPPVPSEPFAPPSFDARIDEPVAGIMRDKQRLAHIRLWPPDRRQLVNHLEFNEATQTVRAFEQVALQSERSGRRQPSWRELLQL